MIDDEKKKKRAEKVKEAVEQHRKRVLEGGKATLNVFIDKETSEELQRIKAKYQLKNMGDAIDLLVKAEIKRLKIK